MIYFTSDLHLGHKNVLKFDQRPFETVEEMDQTIIANWNRKVKQDDLVYILGDVSWYNAEKTSAILKQLHGHKVLIQGNHDKRYWLNESTAALFDEVCGYKEIKLPQGRHIVLCHYPIHFFNRHYYGAYMLYGHVHNSEEWSMVEAYKKELTDRGIKCNMFNTGCMLWDYTPVTIDEIIAGCDDHQNTRQ